MASGTVQNPMGTEKIVITKNDTNNIIKNENHHYVYKSGGFKLLRLGLEFNSYTGVNAFKVIYDLPSSCLPYENIGCNCLTTNGKVIVLQVTTAGKVNFNSPSNLSANDSISFVFPYI